MDGPDFDDYVRAEPFRALAKRWKEPVASLAYRYALSIHSISSIILGVKNRDELKDCIEAEQKERLTTDQIEEIDKAMSSE